MTTAAVCKSLGAELTIHEIDVQPPGPNEVAVRLEASGVCHTDFSAASGRLTVPFPIVLGHEGAGVVVEVGPGVEDVHIGDHVVITWVPTCGTCFHCAHDEGHLCIPGTRANQTGTMLDGTTRYSLDGVSLRQLGAAGTFSRRTVVAASSVVPIDPTFPLDLAALLGCAVLTGAGAALNTATIGSGTTVAILGCGGVGLAALQGARIAGAERVIAVDRADKKLSAAADLGATHVVRASDDSRETLTAIRQAAGQPGADVVIEAVGLPSTIDLAVRATRAGGQTVLVGAPSPQERLGVPLLTGLILPGRTLIGSWYGSSVPRRDVPRLIDHVRTGELDLETMIGDRIGLDDINAAFAKLNNGADGRSVVLF